MSWLSSLTGSEAAKTSNAAAADTYGKQKSAIDSLMSYGDTLPGQYKDIAKGYDQYRSAGSDALTRLMGGLGLGSSQDSIDFTNAFHNLPGYESGLNTGTRAVAGHFNAGGMGQSGAAEKGLYKFGSDYEDQRSKDYLGELMGLTNTGEQATGAATGLEAAGVGAGTGVRQSAFGGDMTAAGTIGQGMVAGAQAKQQGLQNLLSTGAYLAGSYLGGGAKPPGGGMSYPTAAGQSNGGTYWPAPRMA